MHTSTSLRISRTQPGDQGHGRPKMEARGSMDYDVMLAGDARQVLHVVKIAENNRLDAPHLEHICLLLLPHQGRDAQVLDEWV